MPSVKQLWETLQPSKAPASPAPPQKEGKSISQSSCALTWAQEEISCTEILVKPGNLLCWFCASVITGDPFGITKAIKSWKGKVRMGNVDFCKGREQESPGESEEAERDILPMSSVCS